MAGRLAFFQTRPGRAQDALAQAQRIAWGPMAFQAVDALQRLGLLSVAESKGERGLTIAEAARAGRVPPYGARVLLEAGLGCGVFFLNGRNRFVLTKTGLCFLYDRMTRVNLNFMRDVCYHGAASLEKSVRRGKPEGLKALGPWPTIYEGLSKLDPHIQKSWFAFDHFYSDAAYSHAATQVLARHPAMVYDVGGNTGRFASLLCQTDSSVRVTLLDLPGQLAKAKSFLKGEPFQTRISTHPIDVLSKTPFPKGADAVWMSQFLDCFSETEIVSILKKAKRCLRPGGEIFIMEPFWDRQDQEMAAVSLLMISLYFTTMANGNSRMYRASDMLPLIHRAGLKVVKDQEHLGLCHTLLTCIEK